MAPTIPRDFDNPPAKVISPSKLAHVVLRSNNFKQMCNFYTSFLGGHTVFANDFLAFITYDDEHHRIAIIGMPDLGDKNPQTSGLEHIAFTFDSLSDLAVAYRQRKKLGMTPIWCVNHGPTTSMYYKDPDGNILETQVDNFEDPEDATKFMMGKEFGENPIGTDFDPEEFVERLRSGEDEGRIKVRREIGQRGVEGVPG